MAQHGTMTHSPLNSTALAWICILYRKPLNNALKNFVLYAFFACHISLLGRLYVASQIVFSFIFVSCYCLRLSQAVFVFLSVVA